MTGLKYSTFKVGSQAEGYVLTLGGFSSTPEFRDDFGIVQNAVKFSTEDKEQDNNRIVHCASKYGGGWWYNKCFDVKFTGPHFEGSHSVGQGIHWDSLIGGDHSMKKASMKLRRKINDCQS